MGFGGGWEEQAGVFLCGTFVLRIYGMPRYGVARKRSAAPCGGGSFGFAEGIFFYWNVISGRVRMDFCTDGGEWSGSGTTEHRQETEFGPYSYFSDSYLVQV